MLYYYPSNNIESLAYLTAEIMRRKPLTSVFTEEQLIVQSHGLGAWLEHCIADELGVSAMVRSNMAGAFIWSLIEQDNVQDKHVKRFEKDCLKWEVLNQLVEKINDDEFLLLRKYLNALSGKDKRVDDLDPIALFNLASSIADVFDAYQNYRPDWLLQWEDNKAIDRHTDSAGTSFRKLGVDNTFFGQLESWQSSLWRSLYSDIPLNQRMHRARLMETINHSINNNSSFISSLITAGRLPERVFIFGLTAWPPSAFNLIRALGEHIDVHWMVMNPCQYYWGDILTEHQRFRAQKVLVEKGVSVVTAEASLDEQNDLLASWGIVGKDYLSLLMQENYFGSEGSFSELYQTPDDVSTMTALQGIQANILKLENREIVVSEDDASIRFSDAHSELRELESLRDYLLSSFDHNPELAPKDVIVMVPQIEKYAPFIDAVFSKPFVNESGVEQHLLFSISDQSLNSDDQTISVLKEILTINTQRLTVNQVLKWLDLQSIANSFGFEDEDLDWLKSKLTDLNTHWGLDHSHIQTFTANPTFNGRFDWYSSLHRLIIGFLTGKNEALSWDNKEILPESIFSIYERECVGKLACLLDQVHWTMQSLSTEKTVPEHVTLLGQILHSWFDLDSMHDSTKTSLFSKLDEIAQHADSAGFVEKVPFTVVAREFVRSLDKEKSSQRFLSGAINFCTLMPMRTIPFKVVCLLGMNDGEYPRIEQKPSFDLMEHSPRRVGDRNRREDDRYLFLEALCSAREKIYVSYVGRSIKDNSQRYPSVLVQELQAYCQKLIKGEQVDDIIATWTHVHRLQPFHTDYYMRVAQSNVDGCNTQSDRTSSDLKTFDNTWLDLLNRHLLEQRDEKLTNDENEFCGNESHAQLELFAQSEEIVSEVPERQELELDVHLEEFISALVEPLKYFYKTQFGLVRPYHDEGPQDNEVFAMDGIGIDRLRRDLLAYDAQTRSLNNQLEDDNADHLFKYWELSGLLPSAPVGEMVVAGVMSDLEELRAYLYSLESIESKYLAFDAAPILNAELNHIAMTSSGRFIYCDGILHEISLSRYRAKSFFTLWIKHVISSALRVESSLLTPHSDLPADGSTSRLVSLDEVCEFPALNQQQATDYLTELLSAFLSVRSMAVPFFYQSAYSLIFESESKAKQWFNGSMVLSGESEQLEWLRYLEFQAGQPSDAVPDYSMYALYQQVLRHRDEFVFMPIAEVSEA